MINLDVLRDAEISRQRGKYTIRISKSPNFFSRAYRNSLDDDRTYISRITVPDAVDWTGNECYGYMELADKSASILIHSFAVHGKLKAPQTS